MAQGGRVMLDPIIRAELEATGLPWDLVPGKRHVHVRLNDKLVGILPRGKQPSADRRPMLNLRSQIRRAAREMNS